MLHLVRRRSRPSLVRLAIVALFLLLAGLTVATRAGAQSAAPAWQRAVDSLIEAGMASSKTPGVQVAIALDGRVIYTRGYGVADIETSRPVTAQTLFRVGSVTKMVTGILLAELAEEGKLDLDAPIARYVTELEGKRVGRVTAHQLLTHSAGWLDNAVAYGRMGEGALGEVMREVSDTMFFTEPGRIISYSNPGFSMAGYVAERAADHRFGAQADDRILRRTGMPHATFRPLEAMTRDFSQGHVGMPGNPGVIVRPFTENTAQWAAGFLMASAQDMARFAIALMDDGMLDGTRAFSSGAVRRVTTGHMALPSDSMARYGYGVMIGRQANTRVWQHGGAINGFDAQVTMFPDKRLAVVVLDNRGGAPLNGLITLVAREVGGLTLPTPPEPAAPRVPTRAEASALVGTYAQGRTRVVIFTERDTLKLQQGPVAFPVQLRGSDRLVVATPNSATTMLLVRDAQGRVMFLHQGLRSLARVEEAAR